ncbi:hypothetical protein [Streptomyces sp. NPDC057199]|uniref:hypothetical protein n=1 Tax=Streptomyces sp. NPDC057199 TaxID=3346047 RepID=UPI003642E34E
MVQTLAAAGELQRDLPRELTYDGLRAAGCGLRAAEAKGNKGGHRPAVPAGKTAAVRTANLEGRSIAALAREHDVSRGAVSDLPPEHTALNPGAPAPQLPVILDMPGKVADFLGTAHLEAAERATIAARDPPRGRGRMVMPQPRADQPWTGPWSGYTAPWSVRAAQPTRNSRRPGRVPGGGCNEERGREGRSPTRRRAP